MEPMDAVRVRRLREGDLPSAERASSVTFLAGDRKSRKADEPEPRPRSAVESAGWIDRMGHFLATDPEGCWVAVTEAKDDQVVGFAISQNRGDLWFLVTYGVLPGLQGKGIGKRLMDAVLAHAGNRQGVFISTVHPGATRRYWRAGFTLQPLMSLSGAADRRTLPAITGLREGGADDIGWMDRLDHELRGAGRGPDHLHMLETLRLTVSVENGRRGYVYTEPSGGAHLLAAQHPDTAARLLWESLAQGPWTPPAPHPSAPNPSTPEPPGSGSHPGPPAPVYLTACVTAANRWAVDVGLAARLNLGLAGYLALRGMDAPAPYLPSGRFL